MSRQSWQETLIESQGDGSALTAAAAASMLPAQAKVILPPSYFNRIGKKIRITASGRISCVVTTPGTARYDVRFIDAVSAASVTVFDSLAMNLNIVAKTNVHWMLEVIMTLRATGSSANLMGQGFWTSEAVIASPVPTAGGSGSFTIPYNTAPAVGSNFDATKAMMVDMFFTQTVATGSMTCHQYSLESLN